MILSFEKEEVDKDLSRPCREEGWWNFTVKDSFSGLFVLSFRSLKFGDETEH